jgi:hypothetical protein
MKKSDVIARAKGLNASKLRIVLSIALVLMLGGTGFGFSVGLSILGKYAVDVSHKRVDANASRDNLLVYKQLDQKLADNEDVLKKAQALKATTKFPEFRIVDEVKAIASKNHISIKDFQYSESGDTNDSAATGTAPSSSATATPAAGQTQQPRSSSGDTFSLTVNLASELNYENLLQFLYDIEQNVPKLQVSGISISPSSSTSSTKVAVEALTIQMYVAK